MNHPNFPQPIAAYFAADGKDGAAVARCFTRGGLVLDEGMAHRGRAAIVTWKTNASAKYTYTATPRALEQRGREIVVSADVVGNFPGSPVDLKYRFTLQHGKIATLEVTP